MVLFRLLLLYISMHYGVDAFSFPKTPLTGQTHHPHKHPNQKNQNQRQQQQRLAFSTKPNNHHHHHHHYHTLHKRIPSSCVLNMVDTTSLAPGIASIDEVNDEIEGVLSQMREKPYFRFYSVDMLGSCEYLPQELFECYSSTCEIYPVDEDDIPPVIQATDLSEHEFQLDGWARWDMPSEDYYDTSQYPEDFTAYDGSEIWRFIHNRIAFQEDEMDHLNDEISVPLVDGHDEDSWKADFNKAVSGLHSMISVQIVKGIAKKIELGEDFDEDCVWTDPNVEFKRRLSPEGETPFAIENLYFTYMLLLSAVQRARDRLLEDCDAGKIDDDAAESLREVLAYPLLDNEDIGVANTRLHDHAVKDQASKERLWEARMRTRDLFRVMNCVQCNKCRFHGKIAAMGLSTAFQLLLGKSGEGGDVKIVHRVELAALMTTLSKFSTAVKFCKEMTDKGESEESEDDETESEESEDDESESEESEDDESESEESEYDESESDDDDYSVFHFKSREP